MNDITQPGKHTLAELHNLGHHQPDPWMHRAMDITQPGKRIAPNGSMNPLGQLLDSPRPGNVAVSQTWSAPSSQPLSEIPFYERAAIWLGDNLLEPLVHAVIGGSYANAPGPTSQTYERQSAAAAAVTATSAIGGLVAFRPVASALIRAGLGVTSARVASGAAIGMATGGLDVAARDVANSHLSPPSVYGQRAAAGAVVGGSLPLVGAAIRTGVSGLNRFARLGVPRIRPGAPARLRVGADIERLRIEARASIRQVQAASRIVEANRRISQTLGAIQGRLHARPATGLPVSFRLQEPIAPTAGLTRAQVQQLSFTFQTSGRCASDAIVIALRNAGYKGAIASDTPGPLASLFRRHFGGYRRGLGDLAGTAEGLTRFARRLPVGTQLYIGANRVGPNGASHALIGVVRPNGVLEVLDTRFRLEPPLPGISTRPTRVFNIHRVDLEEYRNFRWRVLPPWLRAR